MLETIYNIALQKNITFNNKNNNFFKITDEIDLSKSIFNQFNQYLINKEVEFDNVFTKSKKDDNKSFVCSNFVIHNLLNILNKKDITIDLNNCKKIKDGSIQKKKIDEYNDILLNQRNFSNKKNFLTIKKNKEKVNILDKKPLVDSHIKNNNQFIQMNELNSINKIKNSNEKKINNKYFLKKINILDKDKHNSQFIKDKKKLIFLTNIKNNKNNLFLYKNTNKILNAISGKNVLKDLNKKEYTELSIEPLILKNSHNSVQWKKLISQKILLSISNRDNRAEIHLKPESLGSVHIMINMKNNEVILNFISNNKEVRNFLDSYMPFLRNSLKKNGIKLEKFNVCSSLENKKLKNYKNIFNVNRLEKKIDMYKKNLEAMNYKKIDIYV